MKAGKQHPQKYRPQSVIFRVARSRGYERKLKASGMKSDTGHAGTELPSAENAFAQERLAHQPLQDLPAPQEPSSMATPESTWWEMSWFKEWENLARLQAQK